MIGLEVHAQMNTKSKIFCGCSTAFGAPPNSHTCPICLAMPGTLPVLNRRVVESAIKLGLATDSSLNRENRFARKNYFYPDLPKGYQISQFELPIAEHGKLEIEVEGNSKTIGITRIHMEEDAGKLVHDEQEAVSYVDLNRAGTPLLEIVSEPDMRSPEEAVAYLKKLHAIVRYLDICDGNMQEGSFRCDANISLRPRGQEKFGTRTELKNMNSFRNVQLALEYEQRRQRDVLLDGGSITQETLLWNPDTNRTEPMRGKEEAHDYRYFPDPDLVPVRLDEAMINALKDILPELPDEAPAADPETDYVRNDPHALSALPDMVSTRPEQTTLTPPPASEPLRLVGEVFKTYIITERGSELCLIDKHAAHERILFEQLARDYGSVPSQMLLVPVQVNLTAAEKQAVLQNLDLLTDAGIEAEDFGGSTVVVRAVPADVPVDDVEDMIVELAAKLADGGRDALREKTEWVLHSIACRAAIKAGDRTNAAEMLALAQRIMDGTVPPFCPHGRPCVLKITRKELEKQFGRLV